MAAREVEGVAGKQADGSAKTREAKAVVCREADSLDPKTGEPRKGRNSGAVSVRIDSARSVNGLSRSSEFAARLEQFLHRNGVLAAEEVAVLSDGAPWIRTVCEEILPGREKRPSSSTCTTPSNMRPPPCRLRSRTRAGGRRGWTGSGSSWTPGGSIWSSPT